MRNTNKRVASIVAAILCACMMLGLFAGCNATITNPVVAKVGKVEITYSEFASVFQTYAQYMSYGMMSFDESVKSADDQVKEMVFQDLINDAAPAAKAIDMGLKLTEEEEATAKANAAATMDQYLAQYAEQVDASITDPAAIAAAEMELLKAELEANETNYDDVYELVLYDARNDQLSEKLKQQVIADAAVAEGADQAWYDENLASEITKYAETPGDYYTDFESYVSYGGMRPLVAPEGYCYYKHILITAPAAAADADAEAAAETETKDVAAIVADIQSRLAAGESFEALMEEYNEDAGMEAEIYKDGYMLSEYNKESFDAAFADTALALVNEGDVSAPVESSYGTHIIKKYGPVSTDPVSFEQMQADIQQYLMEEAQNKLYSEALTQWKQELTIKTYPAVVSQLTLN